MLANVVWGGEYFLAPSGRAFVTFPVLYRLIDTSHPGFTTVAFDIPADGPSRFSFDSLDGAWTMAIQ